ncbi:hypothetical protein B0H16DRAFT_1728496 [Mycena metata]|uniref:Uncharacterized protein n=1 Tax=Mycena metata TaxID=1033252 RepID=A0AAD7IFZ7_9AGAR|nr:hypothetical protein B0H16DRAFT_1728496 [Mycena metata]
MSFEGESNKWVFYPHQRPAGRNSKSNASVVQYSRIILKLIQDVVLFTLHHQLYFGPTALEVPVRWCDFGPPRSPFLLKRVHSASAPELFVSSMMEPSIPSHKSRNPTKSALKRPTSAVYLLGSSLDSTLESSPSPSPRPSGPPSAVPIDICYACSPLATPLNRCPHHLHAQKYLATQMRNIQIFTQSCAPSRRQRASREFPTLPPPSEWDEVSLTIDSDSDDDHLSAPITRKVRFVVSAPPPLLLSPELPSRCWDEESTWSEFMVCFLPNSFL